MHDPITNRHGLVGIAVPCACKGAHRGIDTETIKRIAIIPVGEVPKRINTLVLPKPFSSTPSRHVFPVTQHEAMDSCHCVRSFFLFVERRRSHPATPHSRESFSTTQSSASGKSSGKN